MTMITTILYSLLALDQTVATLAAQYGEWVYVILFVIIFAETGLVVCPFLPGDSILFIAGTVVAVANLNVHVLVIVLIVAAVLGDSVNYGVGHYIGPKAFQRPDSRWFRQEYLRRTQAFYDKYGGVTIIIGRFVPIIRTFAPFVAGIGQMSYPRFAAFNVAGGIAWVVSFIVAGFWFGNLPAVKKNFHIVIIAIVVISFMPAVIEYLKERKRPPDDEVQPAS